MPHSVVSDLGLRCLTMSHKKEARLIWVKMVLLSNSQHMFWLICLFGLMLNIPVNSYGHVRTVSSPNHTFFLGKLD